MTNIQETADKLSKTFRQIAAALADAPNEKEIKEFENHLNYKEAIGPLLTPGQFTTGTAFDAISMCRKRIKLLRELTEHISASLGIVVKHQIEKNQRK